MASWGTLKFINSTLFALSSIYNWSHWALFGNSETEEIKIAKHNKKRLDKIEQHMDQLWAISTGMVVPETKLTESILIVHPNCTTEWRHKD